ncbi:MAG: DUF3086 domain-containing protein [Prochloraceae cyanobacterium]|nr:DUF3086 domain-containing protein [Prochloraceae cyanobacterium]
MNSDQSPNQGQDKASSSDKLQDPLAKQLNIAEELNYDVEAELTTQKSLNLADRSDYSAIEPNQPEKLASEIADLKRQKQTLEAEIRALRESKNQLLSQQAAEARQTLTNMVKEGMRELETQKQALQISIEQLERRRERIREEMRTSFAGVSQELAIRVQGFKDYLVGSLQDLATAAEQLELPVYEEWERPTPEQPSQPQEETTIPQFSKGIFQDKEQQINSILDQYRLRPDYYGPPWQLRRTFEPIHAERVSNWFFSQGGRGSIRTMGSRLQNILVSSSIISVLTNLYGDRCRTIVLANTPERLGEWRRGLQDCLGISRSDFGPERGIVLFEDPLAVVQKADRLLEQNRLPLIVIDETEDAINVSLLQFPLWLAFAPDPQQMSSYMY